MPIFSEQNDANFVLVHIERDAEQAAGKSQHFVETHAGQTRHFGDAGGTLVTVPTSRSVRCGVNDSRTCLIPVNTRSKSLWRLSGSMVIGSLRVSVAHRRHFPSTPDNPRCSTPPFVRWR